MGTSQRTDSIQQLEDVAAPVRPQRLHRSALLHRQLQPGVLVQHLFKLFPQQLLTLLAASTLQRVHPAQTLQNLCMAGAGLSMVLAFAGVEVNITPKSVAVAVFIAAVPGGVAKAALLWAASRTAPHLVAATVSFAVVPAAVGAALWLGQPVTAAAAVFGLVATAAVALLVAQPAPAARGELPDPLRT